MSMATQKQIEAEERLIELMEDQTLSDMVIEKARKLFNIEDEMLDEITTDIKIAREPFAAVIEEGKPILFEHWEELATYSDIPLDPDYEAYEAADKNGMLWLYVARLRGEMIGYAPYFVRRHLHYRCLIATNDIVLVRKPYRHFGFGTALFDFIEADMVAHGVAVIHTSTKTTHPELAFLLRSRGHEEVDRGYSLRLR
jgi:GNAT superfamily N-acetyltransferase